MFGEKVSKLSIFFVKYSQQRKSCCSHTKIQLQILKYCDGFTLRDICQNRGNLSRCAGAIYAADSIVDAFIALHIAVLFQILKGRKPYSTNVSMNYLAIAHILMIIRCAPKSVERLQWNRSASFIELKLLLQLSE